MALAPGARLGPDEILSALGAGGMGEVYRARDTRLGREVAIKILPEAFTADAERVSRFQREAKVLASLNHQNIATIHGLEQADGTHALVMELVEGEDLAHRVARGAIRIDEALPIAKQVADALEAAHEQGIIHRDLKPANIKVRSDGTVKVLDFGLAKLVDGEVGGAGEAGRNLTHSPTITSPAIITGAGMILGTAAYMSPEQARGKPVDRRADIWAFGVVLFEMLSGRRAFDGETISDVLAKVIEREPDWSALPSATPTRLRELLRRSVKKDPKSRLRDIGEARVQIDELLRGAPEEVGVPAIPHTLSLWQRASPWVSTGALAAGLAVVLVLWAPWRTASSPVPLRLSAELGADVSLSIGQGPAVGLSPDGQILVFAAQRAGGTVQLYIRRLEQLEAVPLAGTDGANSPFFSPDGQWVAFNAGGKLKKISVTGGAAVTVADAPLFARGGTWSEDGAITFSPESSASLVRISSAGGKPEPLTTLGDGQFTHRWPQILPGGKAVLFTAHTGMAGFDDANLEVQPLPTGSRKIVQRSAYYGRYLPSGHLVYIHDGTLFAAPFDLDRLELTNPPVPVLEGVTTSLSTVVGAAHFAVSDNGTLVYLPRRNGGMDMPIEWMDREGTASPLRTMPADWSNLVFAPDGRRLALDISDGKQTDVWIYEWERDSLSRLTLGPGSAIKPVWTPDGRRIVFGSTRDGAPGLYWQRADGTGEVQRLTDGKNGGGAWSWHPNGKFLAIHQLNPQTQDDVLILPIEGDEASGWKPGKPTVFLNSPFAERAPMFSPDGRWLAYQSTESGRDEVYVRPFPGPGSRWQISTGGGTTPTWSRARHELFFAAPDRRIMVSPYTVEDDSFRPEKPRPWSESRFVARSRIGPTRSFDLHPDGNRFALARLSETQGDAKQDKLVFIFNFFEELRRVAPAAKR